MRDLGKFKLTEKMILDLLKGKELNIITCADDPEKATSITFIGPFEGMFITHDELAEIKYNSEMGVFNFIQRLQNEQSKTYDIQKPIVE